MTCLPLSETYGAQDIFAASLACVERVGPCVRLIFAVPQRMHAGTDSATVENTIVAKLIVPAEALQAMAEMLVTEALQLDATDAAVPRLRVIQ